MDLCATTTNGGLVLEIEHNGHDKELYNCETIAALEKDQVPFDFDPDSNLSLNDILKKMRIFPKLGGRKKSTWVDYFALGITSLG